MNVCRFWISPQPLPLKLKAFKAQGVTSRLNASPNPYDDYTEFDDFGAQK